MFQTAYLGIAMTDKLSIYRQQYTDGKDLPGHDAITKQEARIYGLQEPIHWATIHPYELGGKDPLWAVDCFTSERQQMHFHYISLGFTELYYDEEAVEQEVSGFGFELTFRHVPVPGDPEKPIWPVNLLQNLARYVFQSNKGFGDYHFISANGPLRVGSETEITAMVFYTDPEMKVIDTPHGSCRFIQIFGITTQEYQDLRDRKYTVRELLDKHLAINPLLITDLDRK
jgi:hypothetical protein